MSDSGKLFPKVSVFENDDTPNKIETSKIFYANNEKLSNEELSNEELSNEELSNEQSFNYFNYSNYVMDTTKLIGKST